jgi:hypothetical protein
MSGVMVSVFMLTVQCFGPSCHPNLYLAYKMETKSQELCLFLRDAAMSRSSKDAVVVADCIGEIREARLNFGKLD